MARLLPCHAGAACCGPDARQRRGWLLISLIYPIARYSLVLDAWVASDEGGDTGNMLTPLEKVELHQIPVSLCNHQRVKSPSITDNLGILHNQTKYN